MRSHNDIELYFERDFVVSEANKNLRTNKQRKEMQMEKIENKRKIYDQTYE